MLRKAVASGIAVVAIVGLVTAPASARHKKTSYKHGQTTGMSTSPKTGPGVSGGGAGPSGQSGGVAGGGGSAGSAGAGAAGASGK